MDGHARVGIHVRALCERFLEGLGDHVTLYGIRGVEGRTPTFAVNIAGWPAGEVARRLAEAGVYVWSGHYYAFEVMEQLGLLERGWAVRIGFVHTTTEKEVQRALEVLNGLRPR